MTFKAFISIFFLSAFSSVAQLLPQTSGLGTGVIRAITMNDGNDRVDGHTIRSTTGNARIFSEGTARTYNSADNTWSFDLIEKVTNIVRSGAAALRVETPKRDPNAPYGDLGGQNYKKDRSEFRIIERSSLVAYYETNIYTGFSIYIPSESGVVGGATPEAPSPWCFIHQTFLSGPTGNIPVHINLLTGYQSRLSATVRYKYTSQKQVLKNVPGHNGAPDHYDLPLDQWVDIVMKYRLGENGALSLYTKEAGQAPVLRFYYRGPISRFDTASGNAATDQDIIDTEYRHNLGIYKSINHNEGQIAYFDEVRVGKCLNSIVPWRNDSNWRFEQNGDDEVIVQNGSSLTLCPSHEVIPVDSFGLSYPDDGQADIEIGATFDWGRVQNANAYDVYVWETGGRPATPTFTVYDDFWSVQKNGVPSPREFLLEYEKTYQWQVVAKNEASSIASNVQKFTTKSNTTGPFVAQSQYRWDIGSGVSPLESGWKRLAYNTQNGYVRWTNLPTGITSYWISNDTMNDDMRRDFIATTGSNTPLVLSHEISNGQWNVTVHFAGTGQAQVHVDAEGVRKLSYVTASTFTSKTFQVEVLDGILDLLFSDSNSTDYIAVSGLELNYVGSFSESYDNWAVAHNGHNDYMKDHDGNGQPDGLDYFLGSTGSNRVQIAAPVKKVNGSLVWSIPYNPNAAMKWQCEYSTGLITNSWEVLPQNDTSISIDNVNNVISIRLKEVSNTNIEPKLFYRFGVSPK